MWYLSKLRESEVDPLQGYILITYSKLLLSWNKQKAIALKFPFEIRVSEAFSVCNLQFQKINKNMKTSPWRQHLEQ